MVIKSNGAEQRGYAGGVGHWQSPGPGKPGEHIDESDWVQQMKPETPPVCPQIWPGSQGNAPSAPASTVPHISEQKTIGASGAPLSVEGAVAFVPQPAANIARIVTLMPIRLAARRASVTAWERVSCSGAPDPARNVRAPLRLFQDFRGGYVRQSAVPGELQCRVLRGSGPRCFMPMRSVRVRAGAHPVRQQPHVRLHRVHQHDV